ncbi:hypothetical protein L1049_001989 [Liquidambar formosana]|uniref:RRM domain-containing protein n=1 Tax=Liquidambar formosana TaxID=63359 RepID=A0AAP0NGB4_LIQFO
MIEGGGVKYEKHLDPQAQEFWPRNPLPHNQICLLQPHLYYSYPYPFLCSPTGMLVTAPVSLAAAQPLLPPPPPPPPPPLAAPTRSLLLSSVPVDVSESTVKKDMEVFGEVRAVQMERLHEGIVTVHFYDLRHAEEAMVEIQGQHMQQQSRLRRYYDAALYPHLGFDGHSLGSPVVPQPARGLVAGRAVWAQFTLPKKIAGPDGHNQGTIIIFDLDLEVYASKLKEIFENFGPVKELTEMPLKQRQWSVEFFDIRDAARAHKELDGKEIYGKKVVIEFSHPSGRGTRKGVKALTMKASKVHAINSRKIYYPRYDMCSPPIPPQGTGGLLHSKDSSYRESNGGSNYGTKLPSGYGGKDCTRTPAKSSNKLYNKSQNYKLAKMEQQQQVVQPRGRPGKGEQKNSDANFFINEDAIEKSNFRDTRTTVMIKNIPNKYSLKLFLNMLDNHCIHCNGQIAGNDQPLSSYDFVYLPIDFNNKCNVGYGFVNLTSPQATWRLYKALHSRQWEVFNSRKICEVTYARLQGLEALKQHFKNSKFACEKDDYLPVMFSPPRDGKQLTEPVPIVGNTLQSALNKMRIEKGDENGNSDEDSCSSNGR